MLFNRQTDADFADFLYKDVFKFVDDFCVANEDKHDRFISLLKVLVRLAEKGYSVKAKKVSALPETFEFLGHLSAPDGFQPLRKAMEALTGMPRPDMSGRTNRQKALNSYEVSLA